MDNQIRDARLQLAALHPSDKRAQALRLLSEMELSKQKKNDHIDGCGNYLNNSDQKSKDHLRLIRWLRGGVFGAFFIGASTPFTFHAVDNETAAHVIAIVGWLSICALPLLMPAISLLSGRISSVGGVTCKEVEPVRFWVGLITHEALALFFAFLATLMFHMHLIDRN